MNQAPDIQLLQELFKAAKQNLTPEIWDYLIGGAESETTLKRNRQALERLAFRPRVLRDVWEIDCGKDLLGIRQRIPVFAAPIGSLQDLHPEGAAAVARAAGKFGVLSMHSIVTKPSLEEIAAAHEGPKMFQLYIGGGHEWVDEWIPRAIDAGYRAIAVTVDLDAYGFRERDVAKRYVVTSQRRGGTFQHIARFNWDDVRRIKDRYQIPLIIKGIATAEDAEICCEHGVDVVYVSNHGGRQLDHGRGCIDILPEVVEAVGARAQITVDGGFLRGTDVVKAIALGADAVGIGKLVGYGVAADGEQGVLRALELLEDEITTCLALLGVTCFDELNAAYVQRCEPVSAPHLTSAYPLLEEGY
ncbi:MAG: alpha-hydroxy-acid oxidizing enzyme [Planctomycetaceae bacterium]|nr:alpha-hydroxy-acid oxidizing enzyme [Planctomycetaceae bacterium]